MYKENFKQEKKESAVKDIIPLKGGRYLYLCDYNQIINSCVKELFFKHEAGREIPVLDIGIDEKEIKKKVRKLPAVAIEMTEDCNLRCKYCIYSEHYENWRSMTHRKMKFDTARKGLDFIYSFLKNRKVREFAIGFYGGEPLLNFAVIKKIIAYSKKLFAGWKLRFNITTNLTLLDEEKLDFMAANDFLILVSLDGGKESHDSKRVFCSGKGTFDTVYRNLEKMAARHPALYEKTGFSGVFSPDLSIKKMHEFFSGNELVKDRRFRYSIVSPCTDSYYRVYKADWEKYRREYEEVLACIIEKLRHKQELSGYESFMFSEFKKLEGKLKIRGVSNLHGACLFDARLFLDVKGRFHICERVNNTFPIGNVDRGFDFPKMTDITREYAEFTRTHCRDCKIRFLCSRCYAMFAGEGKLKLDPAFCKGQQASIINKLEKYIECKEEGLL